MVTSKLRGALRLPHARRVLELDADEPIISLSKNPLDRCERIRLTPLCGRHNKLQDLASPKLRRYVLYTKARGHPHVVWQLLSLNPYVKVVVDLLDVIPNVCFTLPSSQQPLYNRSENIGISADA